MFFVDDDQSRMPERQEDCGAGADQQSGTAVARRLPRRAAFTFGQPGMVDPRLLAKAVLETAHELWSQADFRYQDQHLAAAAQQVACSLQVDLGLAAAGDAGQQDGGEVLASGEDRGQRLALVTVQFRAGLRTSGRRIARLDPATRAHLAQHRA